MRRDRLHWLKKNPQAVAYILIVVMVVVGLGYVQDRTNRDRKASIAARVVVCKLINKRDIQQAQDLIDVARSQRAAAIAKGTEPPPTVEQERQYQEGTEAFIAKARERAIDCRAFSLHPERYLTDSRVRSALADHTRPVLNL